MLTRSLLFLLAVVACAQTYEVRGTVSEVGAGGIANIEVRVQRIEDGASQAVKTDGQGAFRVVVDKPGVYVAGANAAGYFGSGLGMQPIMLDAARPRAEVTIALVRAGEVSGRVLDEETREPLAKVEIGLFTKQWNYGQLTLQSASREPVVTDADGRFQFLGLRPGEYLASARPRPTSVQVLKDFSKADLEKMDEAFPPTYWPGGGDAVSAFGAQLTSGGYADVGTMLVHKAPQYRVHVTMQGSCAEGEALRVSILTRNGGAASALGSFPCNSELLLRGLDPGSYAVYASSDRRNGRLESTVSGVASFTIGEKNLKVSVPLQRNVIIEGQLTMVEGVAAPRILPRIVTRPADLLVGALAENDGLLQWAPDQIHFQLAVSPRAQNLIVSDSGPYVKEIRYNGTPLRDATLPINAGAVAHKLEIVMDDTYGSLAGSVTDGSRPALDVQILIVKDSARVDNMALQPPGYVTTGPDGNFPATRLAPGEYRAIAFLRTQQTKIHEAGVLTRLLSTAQKITIAPGGTQTVTIRLSDVR